MLASLSLEETGCVVCDVLVQLSMQSIEALVSLKIAQNKFAATYAS